MTDATFAEVLEGPLLNDLAALLRAEWHDEPREDPLSAELMPIVNRVLLNDGTRPFLDNMLQYFNATGKIPGCLSMPPPRFHHTQKTQSPFASRFISWRWPT